MAKPPLHPNLDADNDKGPDIADVQRAHQAASSWLRYTGMGFQMLGCILVGVGLGWWWDRSRGDGSTWGLLTGSLLGCVLAIGLAVRIVLKGK